MEQLFIGGALLTMMEIAIHRSGTEIDTEPDLILDHESDFSRKLTQNFQGMVSWMK